MIRNAHILQIFISTQILEKKMQEKEDQVSSALQLLESALAPQTGQISFSYQQETHLQMSIHYRKYLENVRKAYGFNKASPIFKKLIEQFMLLGNSLWTDCDQILTHVQNVFCSNPNKIFIVSHFHYHAQSPLLALYYRLLGFSTTLIGSRQQENKGWTSCVVKSSEADKISSFESLMKSEDIILKFIEKQDKIQPRQKQRKDKQMKQVEIVDLLNTNIYQYKPFLLKYINQLKNNRQNQTQQKRIILYIHPSQQEKVYSLLDQALKGSKSKIPYIQRMECKAVFPTEYSFLNQQSFERELLSFLQQEKNQPQKQDILIFNNNSNEFVKRVKNTLKKSEHQLLKQVVFVTGPRNNIKQSLPPFPAFLNRTSLSEKEKINSSKISEKSSFKSTSDSHLRSNITLPNLNSGHTFNNIFIAPNYQTFIEWGYSLSNLFYVFDFRKDQSFYFSYRHMTYKESYYNYITRNEALRRISCIGIHKIGKYCSVQNEEDIEGLTMEDLQSKCIKDVGLYSLQMIQNGFFQQCKHQQAFNQCVKKLQQTKIISRQPDNSYIILREDVYSSLKKIRDLNPIIAALILDTISGNQNHQIPPAKLSILLSLTASVLMTGGNLKQLGTNSSNNRLTQLWRQSGYLHSCLDILIRAKIIQNKQEMSLSKTKSKRSRQYSNRLERQTSQQLDVFGNLFEIIVADRIKFDEMKLQDLIREEFVNQDVFQKIVDKAEKIAQVFGLQDFIFTSFQDINTVLTQLISVNPSPVSAYSGSRRVGYFMRNEIDGIFPSKISLLSLLNDRPHFIYILRLLQIHNLDEKPRLEILMSNSISQVTVLSSTGVLPSKKTKSFGETQIQYHGIASSTIKYLFRNDGREIFDFEDQYQCIVEPHEEIAMISISLGKEKENVIKTQFDKLLLKVKEKMVSETKIMHYMGTTSLLLGAGGRLQQVIKDKYINKCSLSNLDLTVEVEDLHQLFDQFFHLKEIKLCRQPPTASFKTAYIEFQTQKDYYRFHQYYHQCQYLNRYMKVAPIQSVPTATSLKQEMFLQFFWTAWKSCQQAMVQFDQQGCAIKCLQNLKSTKLDGRQVQAELKGEKVVYIKKLNPLTDEINLEQSLKFLGKINSIQILKTASKENLHLVENFLSEEIKKLVGEVDIDIQKIEKLKNGLRKCRVNYKNQAKLNETIMKMNEKTGILGVGRVHIVSWFVYPVKVTNHRYLPLYEKLVEKAVNQIPNNRIKIENKILNDQQYIVCKSNIKEQVDILKNKMKDELQGCDVPLTGLQKNILLTEVGIKNLIDLEQKYDCMLIPDLANKTLFVVAEHNDLIKTIKQQIKAKVQDNFFYRIPLNQKSFKHFKENPQLITKIMEQYHLAQFSLEEVGRNMLLEGSANNVEKTFNYLMHIIESVSKPSQEQMLNADVCGICCQEPLRPYRLQQCGHKFCANCLLQAINSSLGDLTMFPLKCPQCLLQIAISDLNEVLFPQTWVKIKNMALNQFIGRNPQIISSCFTAGCKQVNFLIKNYFRCDQCIQSYCMSCKMNYHPGLTCEEAKQGGNAAFQKYLKENGIRKCPNKDCKMPIERTDGCYRVTCSRCNKSMCFKCEPQKMIAYDHYNDCYKHLTDVHGGYW